MHTARVTDLTVDELADLIRLAVRQVLDEERAEPLPEHNQLGILDIPSLYVDPGHPALHILSREEMYGDDGR